MVPSAGMLTPIESLPSGTLHMPVILLLIALVIATVLYALVVRRRSIFRAAGASMSRALAASNQIALSRMRLGFRAPAPPPGETGDWRDGIVVTDRRSGRDRRGWSDRRLGRGRRSGGDRRRSEDSA
jgi:hypothetical protein